MGASFLTNEVRKLNKAVNTKEHFPKVQIGAHLDVLKLTITEMEAELNSK